jgi:DNA transposition AAA+ family ATPase
LDTLNKYLIDHTRRGATWSSVDESQNLPIQTLEQIRIISNLETVKAK